MRLLFLAALLSRAACACECQISFRPCHEIGASDLVFIGKVESIAPVFLNRWNLANRASVQTLNDLYLDAQDHPSDAALTRLKEGYRRVFRDLTPDVLHELEGAKSLSDITSIFYTTLNRGSRVHFKVETVFKHEDDDARKSAKDEEAESSFDVWTPFNDCGLDFQAGETYLVYANNDESSGYFSATRCTRTRRLTDASEDLAFLFFYKEHPKESSRVEGFTTTDSQYQLNLSKLRDVESVRSPVPGLVIQIESADLTRFVEADAKGRFIFDGLAEGDYKLSAFAAGYPVKPQMLAGPKSFHLEEQSCSLQILLLPVTP
jgi:hypothetical protein